MRNHPAVNSIHTAAANHLAVASHPATSGHKAASNKPAVNIQHHSAAVVPTAAGGSHVVIPQPAALSR